MPYLILGMCSQRPQDLLPWPLPLLPHLCCACMCAYRHRYKHTHTQTLKNDHTFACGMLLSDMKEIFKKFVRNLLLMNSFKF